jgi:uncharacterized membrane protein
MSLNVEDIEEAATAPEPEPKPPVRAKKTPFWRRPWILPLAAAVIWWLYMQIEPVAGVPEEELLLPPHEGFTAYYPLLITHMAAGTVAILTMVLQVWPWLRLRYPKVHRVSGRIYILGTVVSALAGLVIVWWAPQPGKLGGVCMLLFWLWVTTAALVYARRGQWGKHRRFMLYSFAIPLNNLWAFGAYYVLSKFQIEVDFNYFLEYSRWIPWVGNLMLVQWWLYRTARRPAPMPSRFLSTNRA